MSSLVGKSILHYTILEKLGEGGMGVVYKAEDTRLERQVAIKFLPREVAAQDQAKRRFKIEAKAAAALNHPNIATIHQIEEVDDKMFIVMEYVDGQNLRQLVQTQGAIPVEDAINCATQIAKGLQAAHKKGIIHRDIKSANIMLTENGDIKIMDFGLAKLPSGMQFTKSGTTIGTIAYLSPEQAQDGAAVDYRTDIWSFGVVLYEMLTGQLPFQGDYEMAVMYAIMNKEPRAVSSLRNDVPAWLEYIVNKAMAKTLQERYSDMEEVLTDLQSYGQKTLVTKLPKFGQSEPKASIGVLPFTNLSGMSDQEYFCDGMADEIINALSRLENLHVAARTSSFFFKGQNIAINEIGRKLKVEHVLEGSVRIAGDRLRINVQLINAADGYPLWSERYDRKMEDIFTIQDEISLAIVDKLKVSLVSTEKAALLKHYTENVEAYNLYLKGSYYLQLLGSKGFKLAIECFQQVLNLDPGYALAYTGLGSVNVVRVFFEDGFAPNDVMPEAKIYAQNALQIDNNLGEAHALLARIHSQYEWNWTDAERGYLTALKLNPNYALGHAWYAIHLASVGRHKEAIPFAKRAAELDPLSSYIKSMLAERYNMDNQFDKAIEYATESLTLNPNNVMAYCQLGFAYEVKSMLDEAIASYKKMFDLNDMQVAGFFCAACFYHNTGDRDEAIKLFENLKTTSKQKYVSPMQLYFIYRARGEFDQAYDWLVRAVEEHEPLLVYFNEYPISWARIPDEPRFRALVEKIGLTPKPA